MNAAGGIAAAATAGVAATMALVLAAGAAMMSAVAGAVESSRCPGSDTVAVQAADTTGTAVHAASGNATAEAIVSWAEAVAADDSHGYSQKRRMGGVDFDCSSLVYAAVKAAGIDPGVSSWYTGNMGQYLVAAGFQHLTWSGTPDGTGALQRGDIVVNTVHHTEIYEGDGDFVGARHATPRGTEDGMPGDQSGKEISAGGWPNVTMPDAYRWTGQPAAGDQAGTVGLTLGSAQTASQACAVQASAADLDDLCGEDGVDVPDDAREWVDAASEQSGMRKAWIAAVMWHESRFQPDAYADDSNGGTWGLLQISRSVWAGVHDASGTPPSGITDGATHAYYGGVYLKHRLAGIRSLRQRHQGEAWTALDDEDALLIAHNAGEGNLMKYPHIPESTKQYLSDIHRLAGTMEQCPAGGQDEEETQS